MKKILAVVVAGLILSQYVVAEDKLNSAQAKLQSEINAKIVTQTGEDVNKLVGSGANVAIQKIKENTLTPFGMIELRDGSVVGIEADKKIRDLMKLQDYLGFLRGQIINQVAKGNVKTAAVFVPSVGRNVATGKDVKGISVEVEHYSGFSMIEFVPYKIENGKVVTGDHKKEPKPLVFFNEISIKASEKLNKEAAEKSLSGQKK